MVRTKIGETNVTERMRAERAVMGGEGNGGVKVVLPDRRFHVRGSNTEPIVRVVAEGPSEAEVRRMVQNVFGRVAHIVNN
jgi:phosphomannomutase